MGFLPSSLDKQKPRRCPNTLYGATSTCVKRTNIAVKLLIVKLDNERTEKFVVSETK